MRNTKKRQGVICGTFRTWFAANYPLTTFRNPHSAKYPRPYGTDNRDPLLTARDITALVPDLFDFSDTHADLWEGCKEPCTSTCCHLSLLSWKLQVYSEINRHVEASRPDWLCGRNFGFSLCLITFASTFLPWPQAKILASVWVLRPKFWCQGFVLFMVTGQLGNTSTHLLLTRGVDISRTGQLKD